MSMKGRIMIVDDESIFRLDLKEMLQDAGYSIVGAANNGEAAIELAHKLKPDLIIMDVKMPKMNGIKASKIINQALHIPIILLTAFSQREMIEDAKKANIIGYLVKPISERHLIPAIEIAFEQVKRYQSLQLELKNLEEHIHERKLVEKAKGILMEVYTLSENEAYNQLRSNSMTHSMKLIEVANYVIQHRKLITHSKIS